MPNLQTPADYARPSDVPRSSEHLQAAELERQVLGAALLDATACTQAVQLLDPEYMADARHGHGAILETIHRLFSEGVPVNPHSVAQAGGHDPAYLMLLTTEVADLANVEHYARIVTERWIARSSEQATRRFQARIRSGDDVFQSLEDLQHDLSGFVLGRSSDTHIRHAVEEALARTAEWEAGEVTDYCPTGFYSLDVAIGGYPIGELTTMAAMTGAGKTSLLVQILKSLALWQSKKREPKAVLMFSAEMSREQIAHRAASNHAGVNLRDLRMGKATEEERQRYSEMLGWLATLPIHIDDDPAPTFSHIAARCQQVAMTDGLAFVGVDYDEKITSEGETEELRVSAIAKGLKNVAKRFQVPVAALSQYSRAANPHEFPTDDWLRYSGKKEHESALILHWVYPQYWVKKGVPPMKKVRGGDEVPNIAGYNPLHPERGYLMCTKNRFGATGRVDLEFQEQYTRFIDIRDPETNPWWKRLR